MGKSLQAGKSKFLWLPDRRSKIEKQFTKKSERLAGNMNKIAVVYWSGTGNTEAMAEAVANGARRGGAEATVRTAGDFDASQMDGFDAIAFGCPAMGAEALEESEFEPMFSDCEGRLRGKRIALFGSYGWGDGAWMRSWEETCRSDGAVLACCSVICMEEPDEDALRRCEDLGAALS